MNECWNFFKYAKIEELDIIDNIIQEYDYWFSHVGKEHIKKKILNKECIFENGIVLTYRIADKKEILGDYTVLKNNTIIEQIVNKDLSSDNSYAEHVFIKFINCAVGNTYLSVNKKNLRALNFYKKMNMEKISEYNSNNGKKKNIILMYNKSKKLKLN